MKNVTFDLTLITFFEVEELEARLENRWTAGEDCADGILEGTTEPCEEALGKYR